MSARDPNIGRVRQRKPNAVTRVAVATNEAATLDAIASRNYVWAVADLIDAVSAILAVLFVRAVTARMLERYRRIRHNDPETLVTSGVVVEELAA